MVPQPGSPNGAGATVLRPLARPMQWLRTPALVHALTTEAGQKENAHRILEAGMLSDETSMDPRHSPARATTPLYPGDAFG